MLSPAQLEVLPTFRFLRRSELDVALSWAAAEGWNPGLADADAFWAADREGFVGMFVEKELIGTASIVSYGGRYGFVGLYIVRPNWRSQGLGRQFWEFLMVCLEERLQDDAGAALDGVPAMQAFYGHSGFVFSHRNVRMEGVGVASPRPAALTELSLLPFEQVQACDKAHFGVCRTGFLHAWIAPAGGLGLGWADGERLRGYGVIRPCQLGFKIGPLFAEDEEVAEALFTGLSAHAAGQPIFLDVPEINAKAVALAARHNLREVFACARMVKGSVPPTPWERVFGVTTFELG